MPPRQTRSPTGPAASPHDVDRKDRGDGASPDDDHDSPWKDALELYFEPALRLLAPVTL